jgi:YbbR domain-containing protein
MNRIPKAFLRRLLLENLTLKISSLFFGIILWLHATTLQTYDQELSIPIEINGLGDSLVVISDPPKKARVMFRGKGDQLWWLYLRKPFVLIQLEHARPGFVDVVFHQGRVHVPSGLDVQVADVVYPRTLQLEIDSWKRKTLPIIVETQGLPAPEYVRVDDHVDIRPRFVTVEAPASYLDNMERVHTKPLDISGATQTVSKKLKLMLPENEPLVRASADAVVATVRLEKLIRRTVRVASRELGALPTSWQLEPDEVRVHLWAPESFSESLAALEQKGLMVTLTPPPALEDSARFDVRPSPPSWVRQCTWEPTALFVVPADTVAPAIDQ